MSCIKQNSIFMIQLQYLRPVTTLLVVVCLAFFCKINVLGSHWRHSLHNDATYHQLQYHEFNHEIALRNEDNRHYRNEEFSEHVVRYSETVREHEHEHLEDLKRDDEQTHEHDETMRENQRNSRGEIPNNENNPVINEHQAKSFLRR